ncbi:MAG TPA: glycosyl hydrolase family 65 protein [Acidimicrobiales bacterium]
MGSLVIQHPAYTVEPWCLRETELDLDVLAQSESLFTLSNGHIGWRGNLDEGDPHGLSGSYLNGVHELRPLPYAEAGYGYPVSDQVMINGTDGKLLRLMVDDEPFDVRYGELHAHERLLDFHAGVLERHAEWSTPSGKRVRVSSTRLVSLVQRSVAAIRYEVEAIDHQIRLVVQSELVTNETPPSSSGDPRAAAVVEEPWQALANASEGTRCELAHRTAYSELIVASAMDHVVEGPRSTQVLAESFDDLARVTFSVTLEPGERLTLVKYVAYGWSAQRTKEALRDQVDGALVSACSTGWEGLLSEQRAFLDDFWQNADVEIDGDDEIQQAARFSLFHVLQSGARNERRAIPAKGLTGTGYDGHAFWDTETFVLSVLTYTMPNAVAQALSWRHDTLPIAKERATYLGLKGATFAWRTITGSECSAYWPAGTAAFHVNADVADAVIRYLHASADEEFEKGVGLELLVETARLWCSLGHFDRNGCFRIDGVTGPDEYSAVADNNIYTNLMAQRNLRAARDVARRYREASSKLGVDENEMDEWCRVADAMVVPFDEVLGVHPQSESFTDHQVWDFASTPDEHYPLLLHYPYFDLYRKQVVKQADLVLAMYLRGDAFTYEQKRINFEYYERLTVRDSSLSACCQAVMAAEVGYVALAYDYLAEAALMDLDDLEHNTRDGLHVASLAGTWIALVAGLGGMRQRDDTLGFTPRLPEGITRLAFNLEFRGRRLRVEATPLATRYVLLRGDDLELFHFDRATTISTSRPAIFETSADDDSRSSLSAPSQPFGRVPLRRVANVDHEHKETP